MDRILVLGISGSGKSTLARRLGEKFGHPIYHLDRADTIIFLDFSRYRALYRVFKRTIRYWKSQRPD